MIANIPKSGGIKDNIKPAIAKPLWYLDNRAAKGAARFFYGYFFSAVFANHKFLPLKQYATIIIVYQRFLQE